MKMTMSIKTKKYKNSINIAFCTLCTWFHLKYIRIYSMRWRGACHLILCAIPLKKSPSWRRPATKSSQSVFSLLCISTVTWRSLFLGGAPCQAFQISRRAAISSLRMFSTNDQMGGCGPPVMWVNLNKKLVLSLSTIKLKHESIHLRKNSHLCTIFD